jgi:hypothetical protein
MILNYMKLQTSNCKKSYGSLQLSGDIKMSFGIEKYKTQNIAKRKQETRNFTTEDDDNVEAMNEDDIYRYLGHVQSKQINHAQIKQQPCEEYMNRTKSKLKTKLKGKNRIKTVNTYATPVLTFVFTIVKWTPTESENLQIKPRTLLTRYGIHHLGSAKGNLCHGKWVSEV